MMLLDTTLQKKLIMSLGKTASLKGGYTPQYSGRTGKRNQVDGALLLRNARATVDGIMVK